MKKFLLNITLLLLVSTALYPQDKNSSRANIRLSDKTADFQILKSIKDSNFFEDLNINASYISNSKDTDNNINGMNLYSNVIDEKGKKFALFSLYSKNILNQNYRLVWRLPADDAHDLFLDNPVPELLDVAIQCDKKDVNTVIQEHAISSHKINNLNPSYAKNTDGSQIQSYKFTMGSTFTTRHKFWVTLSWLTFGNCLGTANYWINKHDNMEDWEYNPQWENSKTVKLQSDGSIVVKEKKGLKAKILEGWSLDTNAFRTNTIYHIYAGIMYYQAARNCGYEYIGSTLWAFAGSLIWEYIGEYREQVSGNDMIFTPMGGVIMGEALIQCGIYIEKNLPDNIFASFLIFIVDPLKLYNRGIDYLLSNEIDVNLQFLNPTATLIQKAAMNTSMKNMYGSVSIKW